MQPTWLKAGLRYHKFSHFLQQRFGGRVYKACIDAGFSCPNRDGTVALGGCIYCSDDAYSPTARVRLYAVSDQIKRQIERLHPRYQGRGYFAYFQSASNTYGSLARLRDIYQEALAEPLVAGLIIGTRPDCISQEILDLLTELATKSYVSVEYGLQSIHNRSLTWMNRGHDAQCFFTAVEETQGRGIDIGTHVILGLPGETPADMLATARKLSMAAINSIKIHNLHIISNTRLEAEYQAGNVATIDETTYIDLVIDFLELLRPDIVIQRVLGEAPRAFLVAPSWILKKQQVLRAIDERMMVRNTWQGRLSGLS